MFKNGPEIKKTWLTPDEELGVLAQKKEEGKFTITDEERFAELKERIQERNEKEKQKNTQSEESPNIKKSQKSPERHYGHYI